jgi:mannose-6-phosphate isomerase-like protein (cupin superfamily)
MSNKEKNLNKIFDQIQEYFSPKIIGEVNDVYIKLALVKGNDIPWHSHDNEDEMFLVMNGSMVMEIEGQPSFKLFQGEYFIVNKGVSHRIYSKKECRLMLIEPKETKHTGDVESEITKDITKQYL